MTHDNVEETQEAEVVSHENDVATQETEVVVGDADVGSQSNLVVTQVAEGVTLHIATQEAEIVEEDVDVVSQSNLVVTHKATVVTVDNDVVTQNAQVVVVNEKVSCDETTKQVSKKLNIQNHDNTETIESSSGSDSDSTTTANVKMANHCMRVGKFGPSPSHKRRPREKRKNVVFDLSTAEPINAVSHTVCKFDISFIDSKTHLKSSFTQLF